MSAFRREIGDYQAGLAGMARGELAGKEEGLRGREQLLQAKETAETAEAGSKFMAKMGAEGARFMAGEAIGGGSAITAPIALKALAKGAKFRSGMLNSRWKMAQAKRFNARNNIPEEDQGDLPTEPEPSLGAGDRALGRAGDAFKSFKAGKLPQAPEGEEPPAPQEESGEPVETGEGVELQPASEFGGGGGGALRNPAPEEPAPAPEEPVPAPSNQVPFPEVEVRSDVPAISDEQSALKGEEAKASQSEDSALKGAENDEAGLEGEAEDAVEDLAPEISSASSAWGAVGGILGDLIPFVGAGLGIYSLVEAGEHASQADKEMSEDPYASVRGKIQSAEQKMKQMNSTISADQFASKIGAGAVPVGSLAIPAPDTARQMMGAGGHF